MYFNMNNVPYIYIYNTNIINPFSACQNLKYSVFADQFHKMQRQFLKKRVVLSIMTFCFSDDLL